jgi:simple sugar transport system permease protein
MPPYRVTLALPIIVALALVAAYVIRRTVVGYRLEMTGRSIPFARYGGIATSRVWVAAMATSAMLAGLAAVPAVSGDQYNAVAGMTPTLMFDAIVVSLIALNNPIGIIPAALFLAGLQNAGLALQIDADIPLSLVTVIIGAIILFATVRRAGPLEPLVVAARARLVRGASNDAQPPGPTPKVPVPPQVGGEIR